jgi:hypothetical protein
MALGQARLVHVARVLLLLLFPGVEGRLLGQGIPVMDQGWVPESLLEEHDNRLVVNLRDDISLIGETLDELSEGLSLLLDDAG